MRLLMRRRTFLTSAACGTAALPVLADLKNQLKITGLETDLLHLPPGKPYFDAIHEFGPDRGGVVLRITTNAGITGWAYSSFGMIGGGPKVVQTILETEVKPALVGQDPAFPKKLRADLWKAVEYHGVQGVASFALAAADIALWDILGKAAGWPVYKMLGAIRDRVPAYAMCGWYYLNDTDLGQYRRAIESHLEEGFPGVKIKVGRNGLDDDIKRIQLALDLAGKNRRVMVDANQVFNRNEALRRGRVYQQMGCFWYEEPLLPHDHDGYSELARELDIRIATGENEYTKFAFLDLLNRKGVDVVQPDNRRAGGVHRMDGDRSDCRCIWSGSSESRRWPDEHSHVVRDAERYLRRERQLEGRFIERREDAHGGWGDSGVGRSGDGKRATPGIYSEIQSGLRDTEFGFDAGDTVIQIDDLAGERIKLHVQVIEAGINIGETCIQTAFEAADAGIHSTELHYVAEESNHHSKRRNADRKIELKIRH